MFADHALILILLEVVIYAIKKMDALNVKVDSLNLFINVINHPGDSLIQS